MSAPQQLYAEDLVEGFTFEGEEKLLTAEMFGVFAQLTGDSHPIHYDADYASRTRFGRPVAHGLLLTALTAVGATATSSRLEESMVALVRQSTEFLKPAFVGDRVKAFYTVVSNSAAEGRNPARVELSVQVLNEAGIQLLLGRHVYLLNRRPNKPM